MLQVLAFADDLTGALEAGAHFAGEGLPALVTMEHMMSSHPVHVIDTESRHLSPPAAAGVLRRFTGADAPIVYKKTDSSLRGNIAAELTALQGVFAGRTVSYIPAYPALGRTVKDGHLFVNGIPVHRTEFANDLLNPVPDSSIQRLLAALKDVVIYDGGTQDDVARAVAAALRDPASAIIAGPGSVAAEIARRIDFPRVPPLPFPRIRRCLVVNGSRHESSRRQIDHAQLSGAATTAVDSAWRILTINAHPGTAAPDVASATGRAVREHLDAGAFDAVVVFGGDTGFGVLQALGGPPLEPIGEVLPGVPVASVVGRDLCMITKAGAFGEDDVVGRIKTLLNGASE